MKSVKRVRWRWAVAAAVLLLGLILLKKGVFPFRADEEAAICYVDAYLVSLRAGSALELSGMLKELPCMDMAVRDNGLAIRLRQSEISTWLAYTERILQEAAKTEDSASLRLQSNEQRNLIRIWCTEEDALMQVMDRIRQAEFAAGLWQILNQTEDWYVEIEIINGKTGKLVSKGNSREGIYMTTQDWLDSY